LLASDPLKNLSRSSSIHFYICSLCWKQI